MRLDDAVESAFRALVANRMRAALTILGVMIGVAAVVAMVGLGEGASRSVQQILRGLGTNALFITPGSKTIGLVQAAAGTNSSLTLGDLRALQQPGAVPDAATIAPQMSGYVSATAGGESANTHVIGTTPEILSVLNWQPREGDFFSAADVTAATEVGVIGVSAADRLFGSADPVGQTVTVSTPAAEGASVTVRLRIVGVLQPKGSLAGFFDRDDVIMVPVTTAEKRIFGRETLSIIAIQARDASAMAGAGDEAAALLRQRHHLLPGDTDDFSVQSQEDLMGAATLTANIFTVLLGGLGGISLLVGGIGIMNIMLVSVTERTREIGLRKAVGARRRDILRQFLMEAVVLTVSGGIAGIAVGLTVDIVASLLSPIQAGFSPVAIVLALLVSVAVGLIFGMYPARRAALLQPIAALRAE